MALSPEELKEMEQELGHLLGLTLAGPGVRACTLATKLLNEVKRLDALLQPLPPDWELVE
jgi:hypothetical protein